MPVLLDTNVVSELLRPSADPGVVAWVNASPATDLYFSAVGEAELRYGIAVMATGRRRTALASAIESILREDFDGRILPFDSAASREFAEIGALRRGSGRPIAWADCQIAAIARSRDMSVATRNVRDFEGIDIRTVDPWTVT